jgi:oligosaccharide repeat unit polymerase
MATFPTPYAIARPSPPFSQSTAAGFPVATRLAFYVAYYALNACFAAELFSVLLTLPVFVVCCLNISRIRSSYATAQDMIWLVIYMYFVIATCQTLRSGYFDRDGPVSGLYFEESEIVTAEIVVFVFLLVASITTIAVTKYYPEKSARGVDCDLSDRNLLLLVSMSILCFLMFVFVMNGLGNVLANRYSRVNPETMTPFATACLALQSISCLLAFICLRRKPRVPLVPWIVGLGLCVLALILLIVVQNPFNAARFMLLMTYLPLFLVFFSGKIRVSVFYLVAMTGVLVVMPILNFTSRFGMSLGEALQQINISEYVFRIPYIDVFDMLVYEVRYLHSTGLFWGGKTLGIMLAFVPRAIWTGKETLIALDMGDQLVDLKAAGTNNLSLFFAGEFYADWGLLGVAIGAFAVALVLTIFGLKRRVKVNGLDLRSFVFMASAPIIIRGPIAAVIALPALEMAFLAILTRLLGRRTGRDDQREPARRTR